MAAPERWCAVTDDLKAEARHALARNEGHGTGHHSRSTGLYIPNGEPIQREIVEGLLAALETAENERDELAETLMHTGDSRDLFKGLYRDAIAERDAAHAKLRRLAAALTEHTHQRRHHTRLQTQTPTNPGR